MANVPPSGEPQQPYQGYFRAGDLGYGTPEQLEALDKGYRGLSTAFLVNVVLAVGINALFGFNGATTSVLPEALALPALALIGLAVGFLVWRPVKAITMGKGWAPSAAIAATVLMAINSALCCGVIGYAVMQTIAASEIKRYGLRSGLLGFKKADIQRRAAEMRQARENIGMAAPPQAPQ